MQTMVPLYGFGGGSGGTGATLTVTAPSGCTVTVTKDGKTKIKVADSSGLAVFKGLASGEWTISITDGEQTAQKTVTITADYSTAITFFAATIHITYPAGSTCTATDGVTTLTAPDTSGTWECVVPNAGTWTVSCTNGTYTANETINITGNGQNATTELSYDLVIFRNGSLQNGFSTTGLNNSSSSTSAVHFSITGGNLVAKTSGPSNISLIVKPSVDITHYNTLKFVASRDNGGGSLNMGVGDSATDTSFTVKASKSTQPFSKQTFNIDISSVNKQQYVKCTGYEGGTATITIYEIVLLR